MLRKQINAILELSLRKDQNKISYFFNLFLVVLIIANTIAIVLHSVPSFGQRFIDYFLYFEIFSVAIFTIEFILRVWSIVEQPFHHHPVQGRLKYIFSIWGIIDLLAIIPFFISYFSADLGFIRVLRILRLLRLFKLTKYYQAINTIEAVLKDKKEELILSFFYILILWFIGSCFVYFVEFKYHPEQFSSIPASLWWGINAMTTVGYGDIVPFTILGRAISGIMSILGVALFALPTSILAAGFNDHLKSKNKTRCPQCGTPIQK